MTHGDTGSFWSVFKKGVDQAAKDLKGRGVSVTQVYANNDVAKQVAGLNAAIAAGAKVIATSVPDASALKDPLTKASKKGIEIITVNSGLGAFDSLPTYEVHVGQTEDVAGQRRRQAVQGGRREEGAGRDPRGERTPGLTQRAAGVKSVLGGAGVKILTIPNAKSDIPGTKAKVKAAFKADKSLDGFLGLDPDVTIPCLDVLPKGTKAGHVRRRRLDQGDPEGPDAVRDRPAAVPPGLPAGRLRRALRHEPEHRRQRRARPHRAGHHQQGERREGRRARRQGNPLGARKDERLGGPCRSLAGAERRPVLRSDAARLRRTSRPSRRRSTRLLGRPDIGALLGAIAVFLAFAYFARAVNWIGDPGIAAGWTDQAAQYGIVAVPVALLMIGGEFDLSAGVMIGSSGLLLGYLATHAHMNIWPAMAIVLLFGLAVGLVNGHHGGEDASCRASSSRSRRSSSCRASTRPERSS